MNLENPKTYTINIFGEEKKLKYKLLSFAKFKLVTGQSVSADLNLVDPFTLCGIVWAGLIMDDPSLDSTGLAMDEVPQEYLAFRKRFLEEVDYSFVEQYSSVIGEAISQAFPKPKEQAPVIGKKKEKAEASSTF